jgi:hypothetical protein
VAEDRVHQLLEIARSIGKGEIPPYQHNELFTAGAFNLLVVNARDADAFELLSEICGRFHIERDTCNDLRGYYMLVSQLARQSATTEMPNGMAQIIAAKPEFSAELRDWYRTA